MEFAVLLFRVVDGNRHSAVARDIQAGAEHIEHAVDAGYQGKSLDRQSDGLEHHRQHDEAGTGDARRADGGQRAGEDDHHHLSRRQVDAEDVGDEQRADAHVERGAVHVDGRAQRQHEAGDFAGRAEFLLQVLHVDRQRRGAGAGREGQQHSLGHGGEEFHRGDVSADLRNGRVDGHGMDRAANRQAGDDRHQRQQDFRTVRRHHRNQQREYADRSEIHDHGDDLVADLRRRVGDANQDLGAFAANLDDADADEQREDDDRQDLRFRHGVNRARRNHVDEDLHDARRFLDVNLALGGHLQTGARRADAGDDEANQDRDRRRDEIDGDRADADASQRRRIAEARHADDQRREDHRNDHHLDEVDENRADRSYPQLDEGQRFRPHDQTDDDGQHETNEDFDG